MNVSHRSGRYDVIVVGVGGWVADNRSRRGRSRGPRARRAVFPGRVRAHDERETATVAVLEGNDAIVIHQSNSRFSALSVDWSGRHTPLHATAAGKVFLFHMPEDQRLHILERPLQRYTENTILDPAVLQDQLRVGRDRGYWYTAEELEVGLNAIAAPIRAADGAVVAAVSVSGPAFRLPMNSIPGIAEIVKEAAAEISRCLGFQDRVGRPGNHS
jgi:DNA-binding IclR family transcriptional regulator